MSVWSFVSSIVVDPENTVTLPGINVAPVSVTLAERIVTREGGLSVIARTTGEFPEPDEPPSSVCVRQLASPAQRNSKETARICEIRAIASQGSCARAPSDCATRCPLSSCLDTPTTLQT